MSSELARLGEAIKVGAAPVPAGVLLSQGVVTAVDGLTMRCTIVLSGDTTNLIASVPVLSGHAPPVGATVWVLRNGTDLLILGPQVQGSAGRPVKARVLVTAATVTLTINSTARHIVANHVLTNVPLIAGRWYKVRARGGCALNSATGSGLLIVKTGVTISDGVDLVSTDINPAQVTNSRSRWAVETPFQATATALTNFLCTANRTAVTSFSFTVGAYGTDDPGLLTVEEYALDDASVMDVV